MSVIQRIRDRAGWIVFSAIALALIAFIVQDALVRKGSIFSDTSTIGKVDGKKISREDFEKQLTLLEQQYNGRAQRSQLIGNVWNVMVNVAVMTQQFEKLGLTVKGKELSDVLFGKNPPQWLQQIFTDPNTGIFDINKARQQFGEIKKKADDPQVVELYRTYIEPTIQQTLAQKYQSLITQALYVPEWMAEKMNADNKSVANIKYVSIPYASVNDSSIKVTDDDINAYVKKHAKLYEQQDETRSISYVSFDASASAEDSLAVFAQLNQMKPEFAAAQDVKSFVASKGTEAPFYDSYLSKKEIKQKVNDSLFVLPEGSVYGPYLDGGNYVIAKMAGIKQLPDSVRVRHILVATHQQQQSGEMMRTRDDSTARKTLDSAISQINMGKNFDSVCAKYSEDPGSKDKGGVYDYFQSGKMVDAFNDFCFTGKVGEKRVVQTPYGFHYIEILGQKGNTPAYKIAYISKPVITSQETVNAANTAATQFAATSRNRKDFDTNAARLNLKTVSAGDIKENDFNIPGMGESRQLVKWIYENKPGAVSEPVQVDEKYIAAIITAVNKAGLPTATFIRPQVESFVRNEKKAKQILATKIKGNTLEEIAGSAGVAVSAADSISFKSPVIPNIGNEEAVLGAAFNKQIQGKVSSPIAGKSGIFVVKGEGIYATASIESNPDTERKNMETSLKQVAGYRAIGALRLAAEVKDYRNNFY